jgi:cytochrome c553
MTAAGGVDVPERVQADAGLWRGVSPLGRILLNRCWAVLLVLPSAMAAAGDAAQGREKAAGCSNCHGIQGIAPAPNFPNLAGQKEAYLVKALRAYREGERHDPIMKGMVASLSDDNIQNLAAYFASLPRK